MASQADESELAEIKRLAADSSLVRVTNTAKWDLIAAHLTTADICDEIIRWIDAGETVKVVTLRGQHAGQSAYEMKPKFNGKQMYLKVTLCALDSSGEYMLLISAHPPH